MALSAIRVSARNAQVDGFVGEYDTGATDPGGSYDGYTAGHAVLLFSCEMSNPAYGASASGTATANAISDETSAPATGTAAAGRAEDRANTTVHDFSIGTSGEDLNLSSVAITATDVVSITSATITAPAS